jgi:hypothetical protein
LIHDYNAIVHKDSNTYQPTVLYSVYDDTIVAEMIAAYMVRCAITSQLQ